MLKRLAKKETIIQRIPKVPTQLKKSMPHSYADSPFVDSISIIEMPKKFTFPNMKLYDSTVDPKYHISSYNQKMFSSAIPHGLREACMCNTFGSSLIELAFQWYTNMPNNSIASFSQLTLQEIWSLATKLLARNK